VYEGCYGSSACTGTVAISGTSTLTQVPAVSAFPTVAPTQSSSGVTPTIFTCTPYSLPGSSSFAYCGVRACGGNTIVASVCPDHSGAYTGDTMLYLYGPGGNLLAFNDDGGTCSPGSEFTYTVPAGSPCQTYEVYEGCYSSACSGTVAISGTSTLTQVPAFSAFPTVAPTSSSGSVNIISYLIFSLIFLYHFLSFLIR
jgi:hypothetical protein